MKRCKKDANRALGQNLFVRCVVQFDRQWLDKQHPADPKIEVSAVGKNVEETTESAILELASQRKPSHQIRTNQPVLKHFYFSVILNIMLHAVKNCCSTAPRAS
jgi:hypothetical protein